MYASFQIHWLVNFAFSIEWICLAIMKDLNKGQIPVFLLH